MGLIHRVKIVKYYAKTCVTSNLDLFSHSFDVVFTRFNLFLQLFDFIIQNKFKLLKLLILLFQIVNSFFLKYIFIWLKRTKFWWKPYFVLDCFISLLDLFLQSMDILLQWFNNIFKFYFILLHCLDDFILSINVFVQAVKLKNAILCHQMMTHNVKGESPSFS